MPDPLLKLKSESCVNNKKDKKIHYRTILFDLHVLPYGKLECHIVFFTTPKFRDKNYKILSPGTKTAGLRIYPRAKEA
jgi:hypothetical protein